MKGALGHLTVDGLRKGMVILLGCDGPYRAPLLQSQAGFHEGEFVYENIPQTTNITTKKKRPREMAVVNESCTGCEACVPFCPVNCIDHATPGNAGAVIPPIRIRWHECIGCKICARVCESMAWNAIDMVPIDRFEQLSEITVDNSAHPEHAEADYTRHLDLLGLGQRRSE
ncbi:MAG: ferredoxin family protein [Candidatus Methylomirabilales bacterium]